MKKTFDNFLSVKSDILKNIKQGMNITRDEVAQTLEDNVMGYYDIGNPVKYVRTGTLLESPTTSSVTGSKNHLEFITEMDEGIHYNTGSFSGAEVIEATETGAFGNTLGNHRYFEATRKAIPEIVNRNMSKYLK